MVVIQRPPVADLYQKNYCGVDRSQQYRSKNPIGRPSKKFWKYFMNFILEISMINSFLLWSATPGTVKPTSHFSLNDYMVQVAECLVGDFSSRKRARVALQGCVTAAGAARHVVTKMDGLKKRCKWCYMNLSRHETVYGCATCDVHLCRGGCFQSYHLHYLLPLE